MAISTARWRGHRFMGESKVKSRKRNVPPLAVLFLPEAVGLRGKLGPSEDKRRAGTFGLSAPLPTYHGAGQPLSP